MSSVANSPTGISIFFGIAAAALTHILYSFLNYLNRFHQSDTSVIFLLPIFSLIIFLIHQKLPSHLKSGTHFLVQELNADKGKIPWYHGILLSLLTGLSQFAGASSGRESVLVQLTANLVDPISHFLKIKLDRKLLLGCAIAAGFSAATFHPVAGLFFAFELSRQEKNAAIPNLKFYFLSSLAAYSTRSFIHEKDSHLHELIVPDYPSSISLLLASALAPFILFAIALISIRILNSWKAFLARYSNQKQIALILICSIFLSFVFYLLQEPKVQGLSLNLIDQSFTHPNLSLALKKWLVTLISLMAQFKGGEFIPFLTIGSQALGAIFESLLQAGSLGAYFGLYALFSLFSGTPLTGLILSLPLFHLGILPHFLLFWTSVYLLSQRLKGFYFT